MSRMLDLVRGFPGKPSLLDGYRDDHVASGALIAGLAAEALLVVGGYIGGTLVFHYGIRVLGRRQTPVGEALVPWRAEEGDDQAGGRGEQAGEMARGRGG